MAISRLKRVRFECELKQAELAEQLGVTQSFISQIENGRCQLPEKHAEKLNKIVAARLNKDQGADV